MQLNKNRGEITMKKFVRILVLALALALVCASAAFAVPSNLKEIEGLPELPPIPSMKTKNDGVTQNVTLSEPLQYLNAVCNWQFVLVSFDAEGLNGTVSLDVCKEQGCQLGRGKMSYNASGWTANDGNDWDKAGGVWINKGTSEEETEKMLNDAIAEVSKGLDEYHNIKPEKYVPDENGNYYRLEDENGNPIPDPHEIVYHNLIRVDTQALEQEWGTWYNLVPFVHSWDYVYDTYEINGYGMAYEGMTKDGVKVGYTRAGKPMEAFVTVNGVDYLDSGKDAVSAEVRFYNQGLNGADYWVVRSIKQTYTDGSTLNIQYAFNGTYDKTLH